MFKFCNHYVLTTDPIETIILGSLNSGNKPNTTDSVTKLIDFSWFQNRTSLCPQFTVIPVAWGSLSVPLLFLLPSASIQTEGGK